MSALSAVPSPFRIKRADYAWLILRTQTSLRVKQVRTASATPGVGYCKADGEVMVEGHMVKVDCMISSPGQLGQGSQALSWCSFSSKINNKNARTR